VVDGASWRPDATLVKGLSRLAGGLLAPQMEATKGFDNGQGMFHTVRLAEGVDGGSGACPADFERERIPAKRGLSSVSMKE